VIELGLLDVADNRLVGKQSGDPWILHDRRVKPVENSWQGTCYQWLQFVQRFSCGAIDADEVEARSDGLFVVHRFSTVRFE
jgi:hypothetical protein